MRLRGVEFGHVFNAAGARNFTGDGYWFHKFWRPLGLNYHGSTFVAKTTTLANHAGNMQLKQDGTSPMEWVPKCIYVDILRGVTLNAVGLSGPGAEFLLKLSELQRRTEPFVLSFMAVAQDARSRADELHRFVEMLQFWLHDFLAPVALQLNFSCPNVGLQPTKLVNEMYQSLSIAAEIGVPIVPKINVLVPVPVMAEVATHSACDAICCSNTIPWGALPNRIPWRKLFGSDTSPLRRRGIPADGGLGGKPLLPLVCEWIAEARAAGLIKPIIGCGGILSRRDADLVIKAGANAIELGSVSILRPWRVAGIIRHVNRRLGSPKTNHCI